MTFRFAILRHLFPSPAARSDHWDLLLELPPNPIFPVAAERPLMAFELLTPPNSWVLPTNAHRLPNHRDLYLNYEGEISGGRGSVRRVQWGTIRWRTIESGILELRVDSVSPPYASPDEQARPQNPPKQGKQGSVIQAAVMLRLTRPDGELDENRWTLQSLP